MAGVEFVMENGGGLIALDGSCEHLAIVGPAKIDAGRPALHPGPL